MSKVFVGSLSWNTTTPALVDRFAEYGTIEDARILTDRETGRSRGYGFITFATEEAAQNAIAQANETEFDGRVIKVSWPIVREDNGEGSSGFRQTDNWRNRNAEGGRPFNSGYRGRGRGRGGFNNGGGYQGGRGGYQNDGQRQGQGYNQGGQGNQQYYGNNGGYQNQGEDAAFEQ